jgi:hypothetical protein
MHTCTTCERQIDFNARNSHVAPGGGYVHVDGHACYRARRVASWEFEEFYGIRVTGSPRLRPRRGPAEPDLDA